jgi:hypothetical protein
MAGDSPWISSVVNGIVEFNCEFLFKVDRDDEGGVSNSFSVITSLLLV